MPTTRIHMSRYEAKCDQLLAERHKIYDSEATFLTCTHPRTVISIAHQASDTGQRRAMLKHNPEKKQIAGDPQKSYDRPPHSSGITAVHIQVHDTDITVNSHETRVSTDQYKRDCDQLKTPPHTCYCAP